MLAVAILRPVRNRHYERSWNSTAVGFHEFRKVVTEAVPPDLEIHMVLDYYSTHETTIIRAWLAGSPHFHLHFTPTSASWSSGSRI